VKRVTPRPAIRKRALVRAVDRLAEPSGELREHLARFKELVVADATVIRPRDDVSSVIVAENRRWRGASRSLAGRHLGDVTAGLDREVVDLLVEVEFTGRRLSRHAGHERSIFRVVGVRPGGGLRCAHGTAREYHWCMRPTCR